MASYKPTLLFRIYPNVVYSRLLARDAPYLCAQLGMILFTLASCVPTLWRGGNSGAQLLLLSRQPTESMPQRGGGYRAV